MIEFREVSFTYHYEKYPLFSGLSFALPQGTSTVLCDIQSGKGTLCKLILGEISPDSGQIVVDAQQVGGKQTPPVSALYLPNEPTFFAGKSVLSNLRYPSKVRKILPQNSAKIDEIRQRFGLQNGQKVKKLSAEQRKVLALARGLTVPRDIVLFDGFFDDTFQNEQLLPNNVLPLFNCTHKVILTSNPALAQGYTVVLDGGKCVFQGDSNQALTVVDSLQWLANKI